MCERWVSISVKLDLDRSVLDVARGIQMARPEHLAFLKRGVKSWNSWRFANGLIHPDLSQADLAGDDLQGANFRECDLTGANLENSFCPRVDCWNADLSGANLTKADFVHASLCDTKLVGANLSNADFNSAELLSADLSDSCLDGTNFPHADLSSCRLHRVTLRRANLQFANLMDTDFSGAHLEQSNLMGAQFLRTNLRGATLNECRVHACSVWNVTVDAKTIQRNLIITDLLEPTIATDDLEIAQFIYLLLRHEKLRNAIDSITQMGVLLLGRFGGGGIEILRAVAAELRIRGFLPIIFDFDRPQDRNLTETVKTLVGLSRFVIADLSGPSIPHELYATVPHFKIPFVPIIEAGRNAYSMASDILEYPWVVKPILEFTSTEQLCGIVEQQIIGPAERMVEERGRRLRAS